MDQAELSEIVSGIPIPAFLIAGNARVQTMNTAANALFGAEVQGRHYVTALRQPAILRAIEEALRTRSRTTGHYTVSGDVSDQRFRVTAAPLGPGAVSGILVCLEDITPLYEAGQMRRDFVANVSHELRTPLTALMGFIDTLQGPARDDAAARTRFLGVMAREAGRMNRLVGDLLSLSRVEFSERQKPEDRIKLSDVLRASRAMLAPEAGQDAVHLDLGAGEGQSDIVLGEADQLRQVFNNLIENALKYGGAESPVEVRLSLTDQDPYLRSPAVRVDVRDHGPGIAAHHIPRLTERFYRVDEHRSRELGGTGLGLAIVKHIVQRHRGRLAITSEPGAGACFSVIIPTAGAAPRS
ncbi:ATP-binding protein [Dinoroseobacter sp. PD6]|uniref:ATP-binding protein n=1 Tax=Dinoroseobacter sp. PD6 TaxID=3028384 RepID=UPI00237A3C3A|nr:ATP-binding protein [Dinoroseobacter sp. PD6]MDD9715635.1 ATP-binding protein [Dinoroseobacter sp. PD6]